MNTVTTNLAPLAGLLVTVLTALRIMRELSTNGANRRVRRLLQLGDLRTKMTDGSDAATNIDELLALETHKLLRERRERLGRKIDGSNLAAIIVVSIVGGLVTAGLTQWAQATSGWTQGLLYVLAAGIGLFAVLLVGIGGTQSFFTTEEDGNESEK